MRTNRIYGLCALQLIGLGVQVINRMAGNFIFLYVAQESFYMR